MIQCDNDDMTVIVNGDNLNNVHTCRDYLMCVHTCKYYAICNYECKHIYLKSVVIM